MFSRILTVPAALLIAASLLAPVRAEEVRYYVWTDENGMIHAADQPPKNRDYETRTVFVEPGTGPADGFGSADGDASNEGANTGEPRREAVGGEADGDAPSGRVITTPDSGLGRALIADQVLRGEQRQGPDPAGHTSPPGGGTFEDVPRIPDIPNLQGQ